MSKYSHHNNELTINNINQQVSLKGWVAKKRNLGGLIFIDLKDRFGITQIVCHPEFKDYELCNQIKGEYVIEVSGVVAKRQTSNPGLTTGEIEVVASNITILNTAQTPPIGTSDNDDSLEDTRLKYRYLDLRKPKQQQFLIKRHHITQAARQSLIKQGFYELETPMLGKSTPEGARDYLVPSRLYHKQFYALPQSPQIYKQLFMIAGFERYFQFARCFRDEDLRADRQPEFTQIDIEASFVDSDDVMAIGEKMIASIFKECLNKKLKLPLKRITYQEALDKYGSDKPDLRYQLLIGDYYKSFKKVPLFENLAVIRGIKCSLNPIFTRKKIDSYTELVKKNNGKMLAYLKRENDELGGSIAKFVKKAPLKNNEILFLVAGNYDNTSQALGALRRELASDLGLIDDSVDNLLWVTDWPLLEYDPSLERYFAMHHPFTAPQVDEQLVNSPDKALAKAYDMVWNGYEIGGGSIRIHNQEIQNQMFNKLGFSDEDIKAKFGFFVDALKYGTPPHGGIAFGLDRICMLACRTTNIKDVIAFPKTQSAKDLMMDCPSSVLAEQLSELGIKND